MHYLGWFGTCLLVVGKVRLGRCHRHAWLWSAAGEVCWTCYAGYLGLLDLLAVSLLFLGIALHNWWKWRQ